MLDTTDEVGAGEELLELEVTTAAVDDELLRLEEETLELDDELLLAELDEETLELDEEGVADDVVEMRLDVDEMREVVDETTDEEVVLGQTSLTNLAVRMSLIQVP